MVYSGGLRTDSRPEGGRVWRPVLACKVQARGCPRARLSVGGRVPCTPTQQGNTQSAVLGGPKQKRAETGVTKETEERKNKRSERKQRDGRK